MVTPSDRKGLAIRLEEAVARSKPSARWRDVSEADLLQAASLLRQEPTVEEVARTLFMITEGAFYSSDDPDCIKGAQAIRALYGEKGG